jgi:SAM-dependent methyltransferase
MRSSLAEIVRCPRCHARLTPLESSETAPLRCSSAECDLSREPFPVVHGQHVLIDFEQSILDKAHVMHTGSASVLPRAGAQRMTLRGRLAAASVALLVGHNRVAGFYAQHLLEELKKDLPATSARPRVLVIGGGEVGSGAADLYADKHIDLIGTDIYASPHTELLADGHCLPFADASMDAVWIQAVIEHVLDPQQVVDEIHRVLKPGGLVFADTPFLWPVHERAFDFARFTPSGHRWLFRRFELVAAGYSAGAGQNLALGLRYALVAVCHNAVLGTALAAPFFWLRLLDRFADKRGNLDAAAGMFLLGRKSDRTMSYREIVAYYDEQTLPQMHERFGVSR